jgi:D-sedoheptulose 7-phosphate isomerase
MFLRGREPLAANDEQTVGLRTPPDDRQLGDDSDRQGLRLRHVFERQIRALGRPGDVFIAISTSGRSGNIPRAIGAARQDELTVIGLTGRRGGKMGSPRDLCLRAPADATQLIQQIHITAAHIVCRLIEERLLPQRGPG